MVIVFRFLGQVTFRERPGPPLGIVPWSSDLALCDAKLLEISAPPTEDPAENNNEEDSEGNPDENNNEENNDENPEEPTPEP